MSDSAIKMSNLKFGYHPENPLLEIDELQIKKGERIFIYGPSGSGKSTLLNLLTGVHSPWEGTLDVLGHPLHQLSESKKDKLRGTSIGFIFQSFNLLPSLNVEENILLPTRLFRKKTAGKFEKIMEVLELNSLRQSKVFELSVGQAQRVAVARALIGQPPLIIADEPTSALDEELTFKFLDELLQLTSSEQQTVLFVSHDLRLKNRFDRSIALKEINGASP